MTSTPPPEDSPFPPPLLGNSVLDQGLVAAFGEEPELCPESFGPYRILGVLGRGGMGIVYRAEQVHPKRLVALKVVRSAHFSTELRRRFEQECLLLGRLQHPGIAQIFEAGTSSPEDGDLPFFAMELVSGKRLDRWKQGQSVAAKLQLMIKVAGAIHHAHQKGVIHRDLKPANIMVDEQGDPKILDFGVARSTDADAQGTLATNIGQVIGTLPYMSPEQLRGNPELIDTGSDTYSLGVILFELLTGHLPHDVREKPIHEVARLVQDTEPRSPTQFDSQLRGDLETIIVKSLEKDPARRYSSAAAFAGDIQRYLSHEPIMARPSSKIYRIQKFAVRHKGFVASIATVFLVLVAGIVASFTSAQKARAAEEDAKKETEKYRQLFSVVDDVIFAASPYEQGRNVLHIEVLHRLADALREDKQEERMSKEVQGQIRASLGQSLLELLDYQGAEEQLQLAIEQLTEVHSFDHPLTLKARSTMIKVLVSSARFQEALDTHDALLAATKNAYGAQSKEVQSLYGDRLISLSGVGRIEEALAESQELVRVRSEQYGPQSPEVLHIMANQVTILNTLGRSHEAETLSREVVRYSYENNGENNGHTIYRELALCGVLNRLGKFDESSQRLEDLVERVKYVFGENSVQLGNLYYSLAHAYRSMGSAEKSEEVNHRSINIFTHQLGPDHRSTIAAELNLIHLLLDKNSDQLALAQLQETIAKQRRVFGENHHALADFYSLLGDCYVELDQRDQAVESFRKAIECDEINGFGDHSAIFFTRKNLASCLLKMNRHDEAAQIYRDIVPLRIRDLGETNPRLTRDLEKFAESLIGLESYEEALEPLEVLVQIDIDSVDVGEGVAHGMRMMTKCYKALEAPEDGREALLLCLHRFEAMEGRIGRALCRKSLTFLAELSESCGDQEEAKQFLERRDRLE